MSGTPQAHQRRRFRHALKTLHLWLGLSLGVLLSLVMLAGGVLLFERPLLAMTHPELIGRTVPEQTGLGPALEQILATSEGKQLRGIALPGDGLTAFEGVAKNGDRHYFDPVDGHPLLVRAANRDVLLVLLDWHTHLLSGDTGETVLGIVACAGLFMLASGLWLYWPGRRRAVTHLKPHAHPPILRWASWHRMVGVLAFPLLLVTIGTGTTMAYRGAVRTGLIQAFGEPQPARPPKVTSDGGDVRWPDLLEAAHAAAADAIITRISLPVRPGAALVMRVRRPGEWNPSGRSTLFLNPYTAQVLGGEDATRLGPGARLANALFPIHSAAVGGGIWRALLAIGAALPTFMLVTGFLFWRARRRRPAMERAG
ncbi:PepSY-associated TM helix domain-containing protein [Dyella terrae]|uniref:PepSY-associated TM helix domain-containing protein n=1 Tax=Dyella terrae TaxID=522259 RepID=UPI001EFD18D8|nr:PepSY-associated TM helix domain-containing protein [Dyella terrae]ULU23652.1 PepSY domain-containing protein [Dyella terrae]